jgi:hypothetical protein
LIDVITYLAIVSPCEGSSTVILKTVISVCWKVYAEAHLHITGAVLLAARDPKAVGLCGHYVRPGVAEAGDRYFSTNIVGTKDCLRSERMIEEGANLEVEPRLRPNNLPCPPCLPRLAKEKGK